MEKKLTQECFDMPKKRSQNIFYKVFIQKSYANSEGYIFINPKDVNKKEIGTEKSFNLVYSFKKIPNLHNPMFICESIKGDDFKGRIKIIKNFEEKHALEFAVKWELDGKTFGDV